MPITTHTVVGVFDDYATAQRVRTELLSSGFPSDDVYISSSDDFSSEVARGNTGLTGEPRSDAVGGGIGAFFRRLFGTDVVDEDESRRIRAALRSAFAVVSVRASEVDEERAADIMNQYGAVDIDQRFLDGESARERGELSVPGVREQLPPGQRAVQRGRVRVYSRMFEEPVEKR